MLKKTAIIIISHNSREVTDYLCENIIRNTRSLYDIIVVETGSDLDKISSFTSVWVKEGIRMTRGFNIGIHHALEKEKWNNYDNNEKFQYTAFWCLVNDTILDNDIDTLTPLIESMEENKDCGMIHPYIKNAHSPYLKKQEGSKITKTSFVEVVCPLFSRKAIMLDPNPFNYIFKYGWGLDYTFGDVLYRNLLRMYISNEVGIIHNAGTTTKSGADENFVNIQQQFNTSRENMIKGLKYLHGKEWYKELVDNIPADIPKESLVYWLTKVGCDCSVEDLK